MTRCNRRSTNEPQTSCRRCGACCLKGGPALHVEDQPLVAQGVIGIRFLYTLREGELVMDNVAGHLCGVSEDIIKIRGQGRSWSCVFFDPAAQKCRIYENRPAECRVLKCWDPRELAVMYTHGRLTRRDLIAGVDGLWDLVLTHSRRVAHGRIRHLLSTAGPRGLDPDASDALMAMVRYDLSLREVLLEKGKVTPDQLDFLFGRPLTRTLPPFGVTFTRSAGQLGLAYTPAAPPLPRL
ncbi:MAG: YkgJ family cysteine cluster protein [Desulfobacterales bacterium]|jgi:Fe-S-cluster containining protein